MIDEGLRFDEPCFSPEELIRTETPCIHSQQWFQVERTIDAVSKHHENAEEKDDSFLKKNEKFSVSIIWSYILQDNFQTAENLLPNVAHESHEQYLRNLVNFKVCRKHCENPFID